MPPCSHPSHSLRGVICPVCAALLASGFDDEPGAPPSLNPEEVAVIDACRRLGEDYTRCGVIAPAGELCGIPMEVTEQTIYGQPLAHCSVHGLIKNMAYWLSLEELRFLGSQQRARRITFELARQRDPKAAHQHLATWQAEEAASAQQR